MPTFTGTTGADNLYGTSGNDSLLGLSGNDYLSGDAGNDTLDGGDGDDSLTGGPGNDLIYGGAGNDRVNYVDDSGNDTVYGGDGNDYVSYYTISGDKIVFGEAGDDSLYGGNGNDTLDGGDGNDYIDGDIGNDSILGGTGNDKLYGSNGNDTLDGGTGNDTLYGGDGNDYVSGGDGDDKLYDQSTGNDTLLGGIGNDYLSAYTGTGNKYLDGGAGNDTLYGGNGNDTLNGGEGNDYIDGDIGNDSFLGGAGNDTLYGGNGNDTLDGGTGNDTLEGGDGNDTYYIDSTRDFISDSSGSDTAYVSVSFVKIPSTIENVIYTNGAIALPYWIDALLPDEAAGLCYSTLLGDAKTFSYVFPASLPSYDTNVEHAKGFSSFTTTQIARTKVALGYISSVIDVQFSQSSNAAALNTITFANNDQTNSAGYAYNPSTSNLGCDLFLDNSGNNENAILADGTYAALTLIHELGHALGLEHPFSLPKAEGGDLPSLNGVEESTTWTVMSYTDYPAQYHLTYSPLDIAALQYLYGPSKTARTGNDTYACSNTDTNLIWDGAGNDTVSVSSAAQAATVYLTPGYWGFIGSKSTMITSAGQITVNFGTVIENLTGSSYADRLYGNDIGNIISGGAGNDVIEGWAGADTLVGDTGDDTLTGGTGNDSIDGGTGNDTAVFSHLYGDYLITFDAISQRYTVTDKTGSDGIDTLSNIELVQFSDKILRFADIDLVPPSVLTFSPADESVGVAIASNIVVTFNEAIARGTGNILLKNAAGTLIATYSAATSSNLSFSGATLTINPTADLLNGTSYKVDFDSGTIKDLAGNSYAGTSTYNFTTVAAVGVPVNKNFVGGSGVDVFLSGAGNDVFDGGAGTDLVTYNGNLSNYTISKSAGLYTVKDNTGIDGTDTLFNVETLQFSDKTINLTVQAKAAAAPQANVTRLVELYVAFFNRVPDADGLSYWLDQMGAGKSVTQVADAFYNAGVQYSNLTGFSSSMSDADFVKVIYKNVLGRTGSTAPPDTDVNYWVKNLTSGTDSRGSLINTILGAAHNYKGDTTWGWVSNLLDNKIAVAELFAIDYGLNYNTANDSITQGMAIAAAVTSTSTLAAIALIGVNASALQLG